MTISPRQANIFTEGTVVHTNQTPLIEEE